MKERKTQMECIKGGREPQLAENPGRGQRTIVKERGEETVSRMGRVGDGYCSIQGGGNYELQLAKIRESDKG